MLHEKIELKAENRKLREQISNLEHAPHDISRSKDVGDGSTQEEKDPSTPEKKRRKDQEEGKESKV